MKKLVILMLVLCLVGTTVAQADIIWEPDGDAFFEKHKDDFVLEQQSYYVNSPDGDAEFYNSPGGKVVDTKSNGTLIHIYYIYQDGNGTRWGYTMDESYVNLSLMMNRYDDMEFRADHQEEIQETAPENLEVVIPEGETFLGWSHPGGIPTETEAVFEDWDLKELCQEFYTDAEGRIWGYLGYHYGHREFWICLSDLNNADLQKPERYTGLAYFGENAAPLRESQEGNGSHGGSTVLYILIPVAVAALATVILYFWPRRKKNKE